MKRGLFFLGVLAVLLLVSACGSQSGAGDGSPVLTAAPEPTAAPAGPTAPPTETQSQPPLDGHVRVSFYWTHPGSYDNCDIWIWWEGKDGRGYPFRSCDYGGLVTVDVPESVTQLGFIVRRDCSDPGGSAWGSATKDVEHDRFVTLAGRDTAIYLKSGDAALYSSTDGGKTLMTEQSIKLAAMADVQRIHYRLSAKTTISDPGSVRVFAGERELPITALSSLGKESAVGDIQLGEALDIAGSYRVVIDGYGEETVVPMGIFDSAWFAENYHYDGADLGAVIHGEETTFKLWAPTASQVRLDLFTAGEGGEPYRRVELSRGEKGVWSHTEPCGHGTYYTYTVTTALGTHEAVDPYAKAAGVNGERGMVVELALTDPDGWESAALKTPIEHYSEAIIWEVHVRDFSNTIADSRYKGKYLAFTESGLVNEHGQSVGIDYLRELGVTHVHLLPVYDYATVDERETDGQFNWGYDPKNYNVPEGSYATDPYDGAVRIREYKQMVMALHEAGIGVIMDMVYNHTYDADSSFQRIVPYYYYRYTADGNNTSASGCGNDTASERYMFGKFMVDSTAYWVEEYRLDGLRFDLMGLHDLATMQAVERAVHAIEPHAILYGEGWTMGATIDGSAQADQRSISRIIPGEGAIGGIAVFNDVIRDGLKGSVFEKTARGFINGGSNAASVADVIFGLRGGQGVGQGWSVNDAMVINYMSAHDNNTLWDKLQLSNPEHSDGQRQRMNRLGAAVLMCAKGTPFWQAGEEMLRSKGGDENSYNAGDAVNNIDWSVLRPDSGEFAAMSYYKGLIAMRRGFALFTDPATEVVNTEELGSGLLAVTFADGRGGEAVAIFNPHNTTLPYTLEGEWALVADGERAGAEVLAWERGSVDVEPISARIYVNAALAGS